MNTTKSKRWNGKIDTLAADYLTEVMNQMLTYGERVHFALGGALRPNYQVVNATDKKMAFDGNHHLIHPKEGDFAGAKVSPMFTLEQIEIVAGGGRLSVAGRASGGKVGVGAKPRTGTIAAQKEDEVNAEKYAYFKEHRASMPAEIGQHSDEITALMQNGISAADAFAEVIKRHFP